MKRPQVIMLHFAGGNCNSFLFMKHFLPEFDIIVPELPGRGRRMNEDLLCDFDAAAADIYRQVEQVPVNMGCIVYGHSMGAYLALRVTRKLELAGIQPAHLIVSGNTGPDPGKKKRTWKFNMPDDEFKRELRSLGGIPEELLDDKEVFEIFEPILRADFEIAERNGISENDWVNASIYALMGSLEDGNHEIGNWAKYTKAAFSYDILEGGHFFIHRHPEKIAEIIRNAR